MVYLTRKEHFNAAHRLYNPNWDEEKNVAVFGKCANPNYHGHNYDLFITVAGQPDPNTGFVMDAHLLSQIIQEQVVKRLDHRNLNLDVDFLQGILPSTENLAIAIWNRLEPFIEDCTLYEVRLHETETIYAVYRGGK